MASRTVKKTTVTTTTASRSTPQPSGARGSMGRPSSPTSPTRISRIQEKEDLQNLNDRLATYIEKVRHLEAENSKLYRQVSTFEETRERETSNVKSMYENELRDARRMIDELSREKARLEIDAKRIHEENEELRKGFDKKSRELANAQKSNKLHEDRYADLQSKYNGVVADRKKLADENAELERELNALRKQLDEVRKLLQDETLHRVDLENKLQSVKEEFGFKEQLLQEELTKTRSRRLVEITELDGQFKERYEAKLRESLQELREQYESTIEVNREELERMYDDKVIKLQEQAARSSAAASQAFEELRLTRHRADGINDKVKDLEAIISDLNAKIRNLESDFERERMRYVDERQRLELIISEMHNEMNMKMLEYQDLMDMKVALDTEIAAYRKLLESEESRLNISAQGTPGSSRQVSQSKRGATPLRSTPVRKRMRTTVDETEESSSVSQFIEAASAKGDVEINSVCPEGKFVKLRNKGNTDVSLSGWQVLKKAGDQETVFKFHRSAKIEPGATVTVWSANSGQTHEPPLNLVMKGQRWFVADTVFTTLTNSDGEEMAVRERKRQQLSSHVSRQRESHGGSSLFSRESVGREELYHQRADPQDERCKIM